jgi:hypothetical protein
MNQIARTLVFSSTVSNLLKEMVQFSQTMGFNSNLPKGIVQADMRAFIHHKCLKSHMDYLPYIIKEVCNIHLSSLTTISKIMEKPVQITW